jgi:hypothetical protein
MNEQQLVSIVEKNANKVARAVDNLMDQQTMVQRLTMEYNTLNREIGTLHAQGMYTHSSQSARLRELGNQLSMEQRALVDKQQLLQRYNNEYNTSRTIMLNFRNQRIAREHAGPQASVEVCAICRDTLDADVCRLSCGHRLHCECSYHVDICPTCRAPINERTPQFGKRRKRKTSKRNGALIFNEIKYLSK